MSLASRADDKWGARDIVAKHCQSNEAQKGHAAEFLQPLRFVVCMGDSERFLTLLGTRHDSTVL